MQFLVLYLVPYTVLDLRDLITTSWSGWQIPPSLIDCRARHGDEEGSLVRRESCMGNAEESEDPLPAPIWPV
jgi:hypothetical protein